MKVKNKNYPWRGGLPEKQKRQKVFDSIRGWGEIRERILKRDDYVCRICKTDGSGSSLNVHHIDWDRSNNESINLVTLCKTCHQSVHQERYKPELYEDWPTPWG